MEISLLLRAVFSLLLVVGLIGLIGLLAKRFLHRPIRNKPGTRLSVAEVLPIDARRKLTLVHCDDKAYLLLLGSQSDMVIDEVAHKTNPSSTVVPGEVES